MTPAADAGVETLAPGVVHRAIPNPDGTGVDIIDIDLSVAQAQPAIVASGIRREAGRVVGQAYTPTQWMNKMGALAAVNGGYFGQETEPGRKEIVGLLVQKGRVRHAAPLMYGHGGAIVQRGYYCRSAFGIAAQGLPDIVWAATDPNNPQVLNSCSSPVSRTGRHWDVVNAIGCGPMLIFGGKSVVTDYAERLVSPGPQARTFVAYDNPTGRPKHLILGMASGITFRDLAGFLAAYFPKYDRTTPANAMCLDGGASAQMSYRVGGVIQSPRDTEVAVPDAIVVLPKH